MAILQNRPNPRIEQEPWTPKTLIGTNPCLDCLSEKELKAILLYIFAYLNSHTITEALTDSACFRCLSKKQRLHSLVAILADKFLEEVDVPTIITSIKCLECSSDDQIEAALLRELAVYYA